MTLHALRLALRDDRFFALLADWHARHCGGAVKTGDFIALAERAGGVALGELLADWAVPSPIAANAVPARRMNDWARSSA